MMISNSFYQCYLLVLARVIPLTVISPALGARLIPVKSRLLVAVSLSFVVTTTVESRSFHLNLQSVIMQIIMGIFMALFTAIPFYALQSVGEWIDINRGETLSAIIVPQLESRTSPLGRLYLLLAIILFFISNSHFVLVEQIAASFKVAPLYSSDLDLLLKTDIQTLLDLIKTQIKELFVIVIKLGLPIVFILWISDLVLGLLNRIAPSLQVFFIGLPIKMWIGLALAGLSIGFAIDEITEYITHAISSFA